MRKGLAISSLLFLSAVLLPGCGKESLQDNQDTRALLRLTAQVPGTKATSEKTGEESAVVSIDALVYNDATAGLDAQGRTSGKGPLELSVSALTSLDCWLVANAPQGTFRGVYTLGAYSNLRCPLEDNAPGSFVMSGQTAFSLPQSDIPSQVSVKVYSLVSKLSLGRIVPLFMESEQIAGKSVEFVRVFALNVASSTPYDGTTAEPSGWYNALLPADQGMSPTLKGMLFRDYGMSVTSTEAIAADLSLYVCPNPVDNGVTSATVPEWTPRNTRLVAEFLIDGQKNYYPVTLPSMKGNTEYRIDELVLTGPGSTHPDIPVNNERMSFTITLRDWGSRRETVRL